MMSLIELRNVSRYWGDVRAVEKLNINIEEGEFVVLLGPSGCGKSTTLRLIAGLESVSSGGIFIDGKNVNNIDELTIVLNTKGGKPSVAYEIASYLRNYSKKIIGVIPSGVFSSGVILALSFDRLKNLHPNIKLINHMILKRN